MRDAAFQIKDKLNEMRSYLHLGKVLQIQKEYEQSLIVLKRLLQLAWREKNLSYELIAYEMIGTQHFYLTNLSRAQYYLDRASRGKFEVYSSKIREFSLLQYEKKMDYRRDYDS